MPIDRADLVAERSQFYRNNFRRLVNVSLVLALLIFLLLAVIFYQYFTRAPAKYFVTTSDGRLIEINPIPKP